MFKSKFTRWLMPPALVLVVLLDIVLLVKNGFDWLVCVSLVVAAAALIAGLLIKDGDKA